MSIPMSTEQKRNFDTAFKIFIGIAITFFGWLGNRTVNQFDSVKASVENTSITVEGMKKDIEWLKAALKQNNNDDSRNK